MKTKYFCILLPILLSGCSSLAQTYSTPAPVSTDGTEYRKISDIDQRLKMVKDSSVEGVAKAIAEVDEWFFTPEDEKTAREKIETEIKQLRMKIGTEVISLSKAAIEAPDGMVATEKMSKINTLLSLYPAPKTDEEQARLKQVVSSILNTSKRIEDIRRLRYNGWAISKIKAGLASYRVEKEKFRLNKGDMIKGCITTMNIIDPAFLEPVAMDLYNYVYGLTRDALGDDDEYRIKLANGFADQNTKRFTPSDF